MLIPLASATVFTTSFFFLVPAWSSYLTLLSQLNLPTPNASRKLTGYGVHARLRCTESTSCGRLARRASDLNCDRSSCRTWWQITSWSWRRSCVLLLEHDSKTREVRPASPVPWVSSGYVCVKSQCRCVKCGKHLCLPISSDGVEKKTLMTKQCWFAQMWTILRESVFFSFFLCTRFIDFPTEGNCATRGHTSAPSHKYSPFTGE